ncbi:class I SAM-dependent methyltransferase [Thermococcus sp. 21S7]|uniref:class I SAM-dependent methyltransferase n=1 Tax=Thermococcus sp. 21S7 TaxID=1638221 RepID=UPI00198106B2|nr:class I SAM-dependent methyltransferase [Thermococcus sp. 21S7]
MSVVEFIIETMQSHEFEGKKILEVGSRYENGSVRPLIQRCYSPREYIGIDIQPGRYVDLILPAEEIVNYFGENSFDAVISTEVLEHVKDWRLVINNIKRAVKPNGVIYITTRSYGFPYHAYPYDFWRYEIDDMKRIFADFEIIELKNDPEAPGVFLKARKPKRWKPVDLSNIQLYSIILGKRTNRIVSVEDMPILRKIKLGIYAKVLHKSIV